MDEFTVLMPVSDGDVKSLAERMSQTRLSRAQRKVFAALFEGGCSYGADVRDRYDNDSPAFGTLKRLEYEKGVNAIVRKFVPEDYRPLAKDLALVTYHEAHRCQTKEPSSLRTIKKLLAA